MYQRLLAYATQTPWAIEPRLVPVLLRLLSGEGTIARAPVARSRPPAESGEAPAGVAVIPIRGVLAHHAGLVEDVSEPPGTAVETVDRAVRVAAATPGVDQIVLDIDSPGGSVAGIPELAATIREVRQRLPVVAVANTLASSAAYWIASQATEVVATPSGLVGGIGVYALHEDLSGALEQRGIRVTVVSAGERKLDGSPYGPLPEDARARWQAQVDAVYDQFVRDVAAGRGVDAERVRAGYGRGATLLAHEALAEGLVDRIAPLRAVLARTAEASPALRASDLDWRRRRARWIARPGPVVS